MVAPGAPKARVGGDLGLQGNRVRRHLVLVRPLVVEKVGVAVPPAVQTARNSTSKAWQKFGSILGRTGSRKDILMGL